MEVGADLPPWRSITKACWFLFLRILVWLQYCSKPCPLSPLLFNLLVAVQRSSPGTQFFPRGVPLPVNSMLTVWCFPPTLCRTSRMPWMLCPGGVANVGLPLASLSNQIRNHDLWPSFLRPFMCRHFGWHFVACCRWRRVEKFVTWFDHVRDLVSRGIACSPNVSFGVARIVSQCTAQPFDSYVLPSISGRFELCLNSTLAVRLMDGALRKWGRHLLGRPSGSPSAAVFLKLVWPDAHHLCAERPLSPLLGALSPCPTVNEAVCPRQSSILPSPSPVHKRPIASLSAIPWVFSTALCAASALSLSLSLSFARCVQALFQTHAPPLL